MSSPEKVCASAAVAALERCPISILFLLFLVIIVIILLLFLLLLIISISGLLQTPVLYCPLSQAYWCCTYCLLSPETTTKETIRRYTMNYIRDVPSHPWCWWLIWQLQNDAKNLKNDWNPGTWVLIFFQRIPTWQGLCGFQKSLLACALDESSLSIGRVKRVVGGGDKFMRSHVKIDHWFTPMTLFK